ncbi:MAG: YgiQ family radical SAM protein [Clostridia bacterium]|nr:YgiQ family radical SAM protein [Clostridia bacterium]
MKDFLPVSKADMVRRGWDYYDILFISADAYVDHPSFGAAILTRLLESEGYHVAVLAQPDFHTPDAVRAMGRPRLCVMISGGVADSMVNHYTAAKKPRSRDVYSPGGLKGLRPDRCVIVYSALVRKAFGDIPIVIGGTEASLRRFAHYDYHSDSVKRSVLFDSGADIISFGMGEKSIVEIADTLAQGGTVRDLYRLRGVCYAAQTPPGNAVLLPSFEECKSDKRAYALAAKLQYEEADSVRGAALAQRHGDMFLVQNAMSPPLTQSEMDRVYALPYRREYHPMYESMGGVPALEEVKFSITSSRGCFGSCAFCALTFHQGRIVQSRSHASILQEAKELTYMSDFKGYIHDVGGPTANFRFPACKKQLKEGACKDRQCLYPSLCPNATVSHTDYLELLRKLRALPGVKKVFIRSGIRYDYLLADKDDTFFRELCRHHISGQLKVAPEHVSDSVLYYMGKPSRKVYDRFAKKFYDINEQEGKRQYLVPYLMSAHPGSTILDAIELAVYLREHNMRPEQVQDFYPTPGTLATADFYTETDVRSGKRIYVAKTPHEKALQRALLQSGAPHNYTLVKEALLSAGRADLIGYGPHCLIKPERSKGYGKDFGRKGAGSKNQNRTSGRSGANGKGNNTRRNNSGR